MTEYREILRMHEQGASNTDIAASRGCSRNTVASVLARADAAGVSFDDVRELTDNDISRVLFGERNHQAEMRRKPDYEHIHKELAKTGVTLSILWREYYEGCRASGELPFMYTQFCKYYRDYVFENNAVMHLGYKPGEQMEVDWAGKTASLTDSVTGRALPAYIFVAVMRYSGCCYAEACADEKLASWIAAHAHAFHFFGGVPKILVPDNLKTGVTRHVGNSVTLNRTYQEMAEHYGLCILPARVKKPRDKAVAENAVNLVYMWILASLRNQSFFTLAELNAAIHEKLDEYNARPFQKKPGSRASVFEEEREYLRPLPREPFEVTEWKTVKVGSDYCVPVDGMRYSVPYWLIGKRVDVRTTSATIEVLHAGERVSSHRKLTGAPGQYEISPEHMPPAHQIYAGWDKDKFIDWAGELGPSVADVAGRWFSEGRPEREAERLCRSLFELGDKYGQMKLDEACGNALVNGRTPSLMMLKAILTSSTKKSVSNNEDERNFADEFAFTRGAAYYGGESK